jgi:TATA-binding protein-associated factor Taf7
MHVDQRRRSQERHVRGAEDRLGIVSCQGGAEENEEEGEDGGREEESEDQGEEGRLSTTTTLASALNEL